jgi:tetratricopeptide (TPR) repeat protein
MRKVLPAIASLLATLLLAAQAAAAGPTGHEVRDLHYGDVLFYFYQDNFFEAITRLMAARAMGRAQADAAEGDLLMGGMLLSYGQYRQAADIFQRLLDSDPRPEVRDRAWFYLGRTAYERGDLDGTLNALERIKGVKMEPRMDAERRMLQAQALMELGRNHEAAAILKAWKGPDDWANYARFNLGVALVRSGHADEGYALLTHAGSVERDGAEQLALADRANVALGFAMLQAGKPAEARTALERVQLDGLYANKALLGLGWADSALDRDAEALVPWQALAKRDPLDPAVQESLLAVPYAMARLHRYNLAASHYQDAIKSFAEESQKLDRSIAGIREGKLIPSLLTGDPVDRMRWGWHLKKLPDTPESVYLTHLAASRGFQAGLKNYADLRFLHDNLVQCARDVDAFSDMIATQRLRFEQSRTATEKALQGIDLDALGRQQAELAQRLSQIASTQDATGLANATEQAQLAKLADIEARIGRLGDDPQAAPLRDQARLLKGVLLWNLDHDYTLRLWQQQRAMSSVDEAMAEARQARVAVDEAERTRPGRLAGFGQQVEQQGPRIAGLLARTDTLMARQEHALEDLAVEELQQYQDRLQSYTAEARFALAQIYDRATSQGAPPPPADVKQVPAP